MAATNLQPPTKPINISLRPGPMKLETTATAPQPRCEALRADNAGVMSPVNQNGSFEFDRVIKAGSIMKRTRKTKVCVVPASCLHPS
jgi:hypothetical protein